MVFAVWGGRGAHHQGKGGVLTEPFNICTSVTTGTSLTEAAVGELEQFPPSRAPWWPYLYEGDNHGADQHERRIQRGPQQEGEGQPPFLRELVDIWAHQGRVSAPPSEYIPSVPHPDTSTTPKYTEGSGRREGATH